MSHSSFGDQHKEFLTATTITTLIALAGLYLPVIGFLLCLFIPLPILFYRTKLGRSQGALILIAVTLIVAMAMQGRSVTSVVFFFALGLIGIILAELFEMDLSLEKTVAVTTGVVIIAGAAVLAIYALVSTNTLWEQVSQYLYRNLELALSVYRQMDIPEDQIDIISRSMDGILYVMLRILPAIVIASTILVVWSNLLLVRPLLRNNRLFCPDFGTLSKWEAPESLIWFAILSGILIVLPNKGLKLLGINGLIVMVVIYFFQGIAIVSFYFDKKGFPKILRGILYSLIALQQFVLLLVVAAGFLDLWIDFRRLKKGVNNNNENNTERDS